MIELLFKIGVSLSAAAPSIISDLVERVEELENRLEESRENLGLAQRILKEKETEKGK